VHLTSFHAVVSAMMALPIPNDPIYGLKVYVYCYMEILQIYLSLGFCCLIGVLLM